MIEQLVNHSDDSHEVYMPMLVRHLRIEIDRLGSTNIGLGGFNPETPVRELGFPRVYSRIRETAPKLCKLLFALLEPKRHRSHRDQMQFNQGPITAICALGRTITSRIFWEIGRASCRERVCSQV